MPMIFLGNGEYSRQDIENIKKKLDEALELLGTLQQPIHATNDEEYEIGKQIDVYTKQRIEDLIKEIAEALTGKEIEFKEENRKQ